MSPSELLLEKYACTYSKATSHALTNELCAGTLPDHKLFIYLVQDLKYFEIGLTLMARAMSLCDKFESVVVFGKQIGFFASSENDYFNICCERLKLSEIVKARVPEMIEDAPVLDSVRQYLDYLEYLVKESTSYVELVCSIYVMEQVYLGWADKNLSEGKVPSGLDYKYRKWIDLHSGGDFTSWVHFLKAEVDRTGIANAEEAEKAFKKTLELEVQFFDSCYNYTQ